LISSSDRRVLDDLDPDSTQTARDRHSFPNRLEGDLLTPLFNRQLHQRPVINTESIHSQTTIRLAKPRPARLAFQLEASPGQPTILSDAGRHSEDHSVRFVEIEALEPRNRSVGSTSAGQAFQETVNTQWQKN
jgi:hypothetical protein